MLHDALKDRRDPENQDRESLLMIDVVRILNDARMAEIMFHGVRVGGHPIIKQSFSWGFGRR